MRSSNINASDSPTGPPPAIVTFSTGGASMPRGVSTVGLSTRTSCGVVSRRSTASPTVISSPGRSTRWAAMRCPLTKVPLLLPASATVQPPPTGVSRACARDASGVVSTTSLSPHRPTLTGAVPSG